MKRQRLINAILLVLCIAATALFVVRITGKEESPVYEPSLTYRIYSPRTDVRVAFVKDFAIDSFKIDVTVITAVDSSGWEWMRKETRKMPLTDSQKQHIEQGQDLFETWCFYDVRPFKAAKRDIPRTAFGVMSNIERTLVVFHVKTYEEYQAILSHYLKKAKNG